MKIKDILLSSFLFFLVLSSWYVLRAVRNEMAVENYSQDFLLILLAITALTMLLINPIYAWIASRSNFKKIIIYCYSFLICNLFIFFFYSRSLAETDISQTIWLGRVFYVWCQIYAFFVVSIFWVLVINLFRDNRSRKLYGFIMAGGSLGAIFGSEIAIRLSESFTDSGLELFILSSSFLLFLAMLVAIYIVNSIKSSNLTEKVGGSWSDAFNNIISVKEVRAIAIYSWLFTALMTVQWISAIPIIETYSELSPERIKLFGRIEQLVSPLTLFTQLFLTYVVISVFGIRLILIMYGFLFVMVFLLYGLVPSIGVVVFAQTVLRIFEYGFNKPSREIIYSELNKTDRYKSSVFIDTFVTRFGDLTGSLFMGIGKTTAIAIGFMPIIAIPVAGLLSFVGFNIAKNSKSKGYLKDL
jgi:AAA family ATP:ADP antiporter|tara:strand:- start:39 stop:1277 length:1239 start_codon:yes stop_codon:yes gene_type:complete